MATIWGQGTPDWSVDASAYLYSGNLTAQLSVDHLLSDDSEDILAVFAGDSCRGVVQPVAVGEAQIFFLTMYSDSTSENLELRAYLNTQDTILTLEETVHFEPGVEYGSPLEPVELNAILFYDHPPEILDIPGQSVELGTPFNPVDLEDYLMEYDGDDVTWNALMNLVYDIDIDAQNVLRVTPREAGWIGGASIEIIVTDQTDSARWSAQRVGYTVLPQDHSPELATIPDQIIGAGGSFESLALSDYLTEVDGNTINWEVIFQNPQISHPEVTWDVDAALFQSSMSLTTKIAVRGADIGSADYTLAAFVNGECRGVTQVVEALDSWLFFLTVYGDSDGEDVSFMLWDDRLDLELPVSLEIEFQSGAEVGAPDTPIETLAGFIHAELEDDLVQFSVQDPTWSGQERLTFVAQDLDGIHSYSDSTTTTFTILTDHTPLLSGIQDQTAELGTAFAPIDLQALLTETDGDAVQWSTSANTVLQVDMSDLSQVLVSTSSAGWTGSESIIFTVQDVTPNQFSSSDTASFTILPVDHPPALSSIPDQTIGNGGDFSVIALNEHLTEIDGHGVQWGYTMGEPIITDPEPSWTVNPADYGLDMTLTARVISRGLPAGNADFILAAFSGESCRGVANPVMFGDDWVFFLSLFANENGEELSFRLYDGNRRVDLPVMEHLSFQASSSLGTPASPNMMHAGFLQVSINANEEVSIVAMDPTWDGSEEVTFHVTDIGTENQYSDSTQVRFTILQDRVPIVSDIPDQVLAYGSDFLGFDLDDYLTELDGDEVFWSVSGEQYHIVTIDTENQVSFSRLNEAWFGTETLIFKVTDESPNAFSSQDTVSLTINRPDFPPHITSIPDDTIGIGGNFQILNLRDYLENPDGDSVSWSIDYSLSDDPVLNPGWSINPADYEFTMSLTARVTLRGERTMNPENILAAFSNEVCRGIGQPVLVGEDYLYFLTIYSSIEAEAIELRVFDETRLDTIGIHQQFEFESNSVLGTPEIPLELVAQNIGIDFLTPHQIQPYQANPQWGGTETITLYARDENTSQAYYDSTHIQFTVLPEQSPAVLAVSDQTILEGESFNIIALNEHLQYPEPEEVSWNISGDIELSFSINESSLLSIGIPDSNWFGSESIVLEARSISNPALSHQQTILFTVQAVNDPPVVVGQFFEVDEDSLISFTLTGTDEESDQLAFSVVIAALHGEYSDGIYTPDSNFYGFDSMGYTAFDGELYSDTAMISLQINSVNDLPIFTSTPVLQVGEDTEYVYQITAEDVDGDSLSFGMDTIPSWLAFEEGNLLWGIPGNAHTGTHRVQINVSDGIAPESSVIQAFNITVSNTNDPPRFTSISMDTAQEDSAYEYRMLAEDDDGDSLVFSIESLPEWLNFIAPDRLSGIPDNEDVGNYQIIMIVRDDGPVSDSLTLNIEVLNTNDAPRIISRSGDTAREGQVYEYRMGAIDVDGDSLVFSVESLPDWLDYVEPDTIRGLPENEDVGLHDLLIRVADPFGAEDSQYVEIRVINTNDAPVFSSSAQVSTMQDDSFNYELTASDADGDSLLFSTAILPHWLTFIQPNLLSGLPGNDDVGTHLATLFVTDTVAARDTLDLKVTVLNVNDPPVFVSSSRDTVFQDALFEYQLRAQDPDQDSLIYSIAEVPDWLEYMEPDRVTCRPSNDQVGEHLLQLLVSDPFEGRDTLELHLTIQNVNDAPVAQAGGDKSVLAGMSISLDAGASYDVDGDPLQYDWQLDTSLSAVQNGELLSLQLPALTNRAEMLVQLRVFDGLLFSDWDSLTLSINPLDEVESTDFSQTTTPAGEALEIEIVFPDYFSPLMAMLYYQVGGSSREDSVLMSNVTRSQAWFASIPGDKITGTGFSYYVKAADNQGNSLRLNKRSVPVDIVSGAYDMTNTLSSVYPEGVPSEKWRIISFPTVQDSTSVEALLSSKLVQPQGDQTWQVYDWDGSQWQIPDTLAPGQGYWFHQRLGAASNLQLGSGKSVALTGQEIVILPGWNLISSPYNFAIPNNIDSSQFSGPYCYGDFGGEGWSLYPDSLRPWAGYAVFNWQDTSQTLYLEPYGEIATLAKPGNGSEGWRLNISATDGSHSDTGNQLGRASDASSARDSHDRIEPPVLDEYLKLTFINQDLHPGVHEYTRDIRSATSSVEMWEIDLSTDHLMEEVAMSLRLSGNLPTGHVNVLLDMQDRNWVILGENELFDDLGLETGYPHSFELFSGPAQDVYLQLDQRLASLPDKSMLAENYPNPFNGSTRIPFSLRDWGQIHLEIFDIRGRLVRELINETRPTGHYVVNWDGLNTQNKQLGSGIYLYRLTIVPMNSQQPYQKTKKMVLVR